MTLVRALADAGHPSRYVTLDGLTDLAAARDDPEGFLAAGGDRPAGIRLGEGETEDYLLRIDDGTVDTEESHLGACISAALGRIQCTAELLSNSTFPRRNGMVGPADLAMILGSWGSTERRA